MLKFILFALFFTSIQCDVTSLNEILSLLKENSSIIYPIGFMTQANADVMKRYLPSNINATLFHHNIDIIKALDEETIIGKENENDDHEFDDLFIFSAAVTTGQFAQDLEGRFHVFSTLIISPQAMLVAPDYNEISTPYGLKNQSTQDLYDALNAAIVDVQREDIDEKLLKNANKTGFARVYTCHQDVPLSVPNKNDTRGILRDILLNNKTLVIGGFGPKDWGVHDGNYTADPPVGFYPKLLDAIIDKLANLKGPDGITYSNKINFERKYYNTTNLLFKALLDGTVHATDVYILIDASYTGTNASCNTNDNSCPALETCVEGVCTRPPRPRSLHFRATCTTASSDTKFITKINSKHLRPSVSIDQMFICR